MIKISILLASRRFSTLRLPSKYTAAFTLNHQIRSCLTLPELAAFLEQHDQQVRQHAKTPILEYLNEFPLSFNLASIETPLKVYLYVLSLDDLNLYEEQLRHSTLIKLLEYSGRDAHKVRHLVVEQERRLAALAGVQPFDLVDAINWLVMRKTLRGNQLVFHSLEVVCKADVRRYANIFAKLINLVLKKCDDLEWFNVRQYTPIFRLICDSHPEHRENIAKQVSNCVKLASLQLHLLGYDSVPLALRAIYNTAHQHCKQLDLRTLECLLGLSALLPYNTYNPSELQFVWGTVLERAEQQMPFLQNLPLQRMAAQQLDELAEVYAKKWFSLPKTPYYINKPQIETLLYRPAFIDKLTHQFTRPIKPNDPLIVTHVSGFVASGVKLLAYHNFDPPKLQLIRDQFSSAYQRYARHFGEKAIIQSNSLLNVLHLRFLEEQCSMSLDKRRFEEEIENTLQWFCRRKQSSNWRFKISTSQIDEAVYHYKDSQCRPVLNMLSTVLTIDLQHKTQDFSYATGARTIFSLENSANRRLFAPTLHKLYSKFEGKDPHGLAEYYILFPHKTQELTGKMLRRLWTKGKPFSPVGKIIAHCDLLHFERDGCLATAVARLLEEKSELLNVLNGHDLCGLSVGEIVKLVSFIQAFGNDIPTFSRIFYVGNEQSRGAGASKDTIKQLRAKISQITIKLGLGQAQLGQNCARQPTLPQSRCSPLINGQSSTSDSINSRLQLLASCIFKRNRFQPQLWRTLKAELQAALRNHQVFALDLKEYNQLLLFCGPSEVCSEAVQLLGELLVFALREVKVYQGGQFYLWCLLIADRYSLQEVFIPALSWLSFGQLGTDLIGKSLRLLARRPDIVYEPFLKHLVHQITLNLPSQSPNYLPFLSYLSKTPSLALEHQGIIFEMLASMELQCCANEKQPSLITNPKESVAANIAHQFQSTTLSLGQYIQAKLKEIHQRSDEASWRRFTGQGQMSWGTGGDV